MARLKVAVQELLVAMLLFDGTPAAAALRGLVTPKAFDPYFKDIVEEAESFRERYKKPPGEHSFDLIESIKERKPDEAEIYDRLYSSLLSVKDGVNTAYALDKAGEFVREQRMKAKLQRVAEIMRKGGKGALEEAEGIVASIGKESAAIASPGLLFNDPAQALQFLDNADNDIFPTGIKELDALGLGPARGQLWMCIAKTGGGKSISLNSRVWVPSQGYVRMRKFVNGKSGNCPPPKLSFVLGVEQQTMLPKKTKIERIFSSGRKPTCRIKLKSGRILKGFADSHPVLTWRGFIPCKDLRLGDIVMGSSVLPLSGSASIAELDEAYVVGVFLGDGSLTANDGPRLNINSLKMNCARVATRVLGRDPRITFAHPGKGVDLSYPKPGFSFFNKWGIPRKKSTERWVPRSIYQKGPEAVAACLAGLVDTDGSVLINRSGITSIELCTASYKLSEDYLTMLNVLGIYSSRRKKHIVLNGKKFKAWTISVKDNDAVSLFYDRLGKYGRHPVKWRKLKNRRLPAIKGRRGQCMLRLPYHTFERVLERVQKSKGDLKLSEAFQHAGLTNKPKVAPRYLDMAIGRRTTVDPFVAAQLAKYTGDRWLEKVANGGFTFDEILEIAWGEEEECWDFSTEENTQSFLAEHVFTHNSWFAVHKGKHALMRGKRVLHVTLEMSEAKVAQRYCHSFFAISKRKIPALTLKHFKKDDLGRFVDISEKVLEKARAHLKQGNIRKVLGRKLAPLAKKPKLYIKQFPSGTLTIRQLRGYLDYLEGVHGFLPDLCIAAGQKVLTDKGLVVIEDVTKDHLLWDGLNWVSHDGLIFKGIKDVITYCGLTATPDHKVWTPKGWRTLITCKRLGLPISQTGVGGKALRVGENYISEGSDTAGKITKRSSNKDGIRLCEMYKMRHEKVGFINQYSERYCEGLPKVLLPTSGRRDSVRYSQVALGKSEQRGEKVSKERQPSLEKLWRAGNTVQVLLGKGGVPLDYEEFRLAKETRRIGIGSYRQQFGLRAGEPSFFNTAAKWKSYSEIPRHAQASPLPPALPLRNLCGFNFNDLLEQAAAFPEGCNSNVEEKRQAVPVYDILNAGPLHRFTVQGLLSHNCLFDYPDLMEHDSKNKRLDLDKIYVDLRGIAQERNIAVAVYSQSNDLGNVKIVGLDNAAEAKSKNHTADIVITFNQTEAEKALGLARLFVAKAREEESHLQVLLSQSYGIGQFAIDSCTMPGNKYWDFMDAAGVDKDSDEEE